MNKNSKFAFTLAEVLITLTVIGVIAAMTIPTLMSNYEKHTYVVGLKKAYSTLSNVIKMLPASKGCSPDDYVCAGLFLDYEGTTPSGASMLELISSQMKIAKYCKAGEKGCGPDTYNSYTRGGKNDKLNRFVSYPSILTADGMAYTFFQGLLNGEAGSNVGFLLDVNGAKKPNRSGRDIFYLLIARKTFNGIPQGTIIPAGSKLFEKYQGNGPYRGNWQNGTYRCQDSSTTPGSYCAGRILEEDAMKY